MGCVSGRVGGCGWTGGLPCVNWRAQKQNCHMHAHAHVELCLNQDKQSTTTTTTTHPPLPSAHLMGRG